MMAVAAVVTVVPGQQIQTRPGKIDSEYFETQYFLDPIGSLDFTLLISNKQGGFDGRGQPTASPMLTAIMSGGVGISGRELYKYR